MRTRGTNKHDIYGVKNLDNGNEQTEYGSKKTKYRHSSYYHKFFEGYTEALDSSGHIQRVYTAPWVVMDCDDRQWHTKRIGYGVVLLLAITAFSFAMTRNLASNRSFLVAIPGLIATILLFLSVANMISYLFSGRKMTSYEARRSGKLVLATGSCAAAMCLTAIVAGISLAVNGGEVTEELLNIGLDLIAACGLGAICLIEKRTKYKKIENENSVPDHGSEIH